MKEIIIKDMSFSYGSREIFSKVNIDIEDGSFVTLLGRSGSGKTTFAKILVGMLPFSGSIYLNSILLERCNFSLLRQRVSYVSDNFYSDFISSKVIDEFVYILKNKGYKESEITSSISYFSSLFHLEDDLHSFFPDLTISKIAMVKLASALIWNPKILILDSLLAYMDLDDKKIAIQILQKYNREKKLVIIHISNDVEDIFLGTHVLLLGGGDFLLYAKKEEIYEYEKEFQKASVSFPFMVSLSKKLSYYSLLDSVILDKEKMVKELWK